MFRAVSYPDHPGSLILFEVEVACDGGEWMTEMYLSGSYHGPTDVVACRDYRVDWSVDDGKLLESGAATFELSSGARIRQAWSSIITPTLSTDAARANLDRFPAEGELIRASISHFEVEGDAMGYEWEGTVERSTGRTGASKQQA